jgi:hypothetical protein
LKRNYIDGEVSNNATMEGLYQLTVRRADGTVRKQTPWFKNLILDQWLNRLVSGMARGVCEIGTGSAAPEATQGSLQNFAQRTTTLQANVGGAQSGSPRYYTSTWTYRFNTGTLNGNYTEVGIGWANNSLFSRALITPDGVNPEAFPVQIDESLDVSYQLRVYPPSESDWGAGTYVISGASYDIFGRLSNASTIPSGFSEVGGGMATPLNTAIAMVVHNGTVGAITATPSGTGTSVSTANSPAAYSNNSLTRQQTQTIPLGSGNLAGGIRAVAAYTGFLGYQVQYQFTPAIPKDATKTLNLTFQCTWARR